MKPSGWLLVVLVVMTVTAPASGQPVVPAPLFSTADAPPGTDALAVHWFKVTAPGLGVMSFAVARPLGAGPFPTVVLLHGSHGFAHEYVRLAQDLAAGGVLAVAACWFRGSFGAGARFVTPIACPEAPPIAPPRSAEALQAVDALVQAVRTYPDARPDRIALFGHSRGAVASLYYAMRAGNVQAVALNSCGYAPDLATDVKAPLLMLHGTADSPADGGAPLSNIQNARDYEAKLRQAGKPVDAVYYDGSGHNAIFTSPAQRRDEIQHILAFLRRYLRD